MKYQIIKVIKEVDSFEEACVLAGLYRQPAFDELPGELFWSNEKQIGVFAVPEPRDDDLTDAVTGFVGLFDGRLVLDDEEADDSDARPCVVCDKPESLTCQECCCSDADASAIPVYHSAAEYFAANPEPPFDEADALTDAEAAELAQASRDAAHNFLEEITSLPAI